MHEVDYLSSPENQNHSPIGLHEGPKIHDVTIAFEYINIFPFGNDLEPDEIEQGTTVNNGEQSCLLVDFQERISVRVLQDPFSFLLESSRKVNLVILLGQGY